MQYRREIDGLRALAVLPVLFYHANFTGFQGGFVGVDIFFVISGFLITAILLKENTTGTYSVGAFYERRIRRLLPAFFTVLAVTSLVSLLTLQPHALAEYGRSLAASTGIVANYFFYLSLDYFSTAAEEWPLLHIWSLSVEEQFYVIFPLALAALYRWGGRHRTLLIGVMLWGGLAASYALMQIAIERGNINWAFFLMPARAWELLAGGVLAFHLHRVPSGDRAMQLGSLAGLSLIILAIATLDPEQPYPGHHALLPVIGTLLLLAFARQGTWVGTLLSLSPVVWIGTLSYSLYLWHQPIFALTRHLIAELPSQRTFVALCLLSVLLAHLTYKWVETPLRRSVPGRRKRVFWLAGAMCAGFVLLGIGLHVSQGWPSRFAHADKVTIPERADRSCVGSPKNNPIAAGEARCLRNAPAEPVIAVLGDSHSNTLSLALAAALPTVGVQQISQSGCGPAWQRPMLPAHCEAWTGQAMDYLLATDSIRHVVISYRHSLHAKGDNSSHRKHRVLSMGNTRSDTPEDDYLIRLWAMIDRLRESGKTVYLLDPIPELPATVSRLATPAFVWQKSARAALETAIPREHYTERHRWWFEAMAQQATPKRVLRVDTWGALCAPQSCSVVMPDGQSAYYDADHITLARADAAKKLILSQEPSLSR